MRTLALLVAALPCLAAAAELPKMEGASRRPTVFLTPESVARAKRNIERHGWAREYAAEVRANADKWLARSDEWIRKVVPGPDAAYTYGLSGCPICGAGYGPWGLQGASFDKPRTVTCKRGHTMPDADHPDTGLGYRAPDGRIHYFVGAYNAFVIETLTFEALENLTYAYTLTGDERYANKAAVVLDAIAAIYPTSHRGCWDYPANPLSGRLNRPFYQASRVLVHYVDHFDQLAAGKSLDAPSVVKGLTRRDNIIRNLLLDGGEYCYTQSKIGRLHNGEADYERGALAVGVALGIPEWIKWAVDGPYGIRTMLANDIDRDGTYYETTAMYADHTRELYFTFAEPLLHYRGSAYPNGIDLYRDPRLRSYYMPTNLLLGGAGLHPRYGDVPPNLAKWPAQPRPFDRSDFDFLEKLYHRSASKSDTGGLLAWLANGKWDELRKSLPDQRVQAGMSIYREPGATRGGSFTDRMWMLFHGGDAPTTATLPAEWKRRLTDSDFLGQKGFAVLRNGAQALVMRFGPALNHSHFDDLNINYLARGYELTYDLGYGHTAATQTQYGWAKQTASHNLVMVDERQQREGMATGGSLHLFAGAPLVQVAEGSAEACYSKQGVSQYRRLVALIGAGDDAYTLDIFRVRGGRQHDYLFHSLGNRAEFEGVKFGAPDNAFSWSNEQLPDGDMRGHPGAPSWNPPPGNGLGFRTATRTGRATGAWSADWTIDDATHLRLTMPADANAELLTADANGLYPHYPKLRQVIVRRKGDALASEYVATLEPHAGKPQIQSVERIALDNAAGEVVPVAVRVRRAGGVEDYIYSAADTTPRNMAGIRVAARFAHARVRNGKLESVTLVGGRQFQGLGANIAPKTDAWKGAVATLDTKTSAFTTNAQLPADGSLNGAVIAFTNPAYSRNTVYRIERVERTAQGARVFVRGSFVLGIGEVTAIQDGANFTTAIPHEYIFADLGDGKRGFFNGKRIRTQTGATTVIETVKNAKEPTIRVASTAQLKTGDRFEYIDVQAGDSFEILGVQTARGSIQ